MGGSVVGGLWERDAALIANAIKVRFFPHVIERGEGARLFDTEGRRFLDFSASWALASLGYSHPGLKRAVIEQLERTTFAGLVSSVNRPAVELAGRLVDLVPGDFEKKVWFGLCGSDANETVGRLLTAATGKRRMVSFIGSYHGATAATMAMSGHVCWNQFALGGNVVKVPYPNPYRNPFGEGEGDSARQAIRFLEDYIFRTICPPDDVAGIIVEAVQSDGGDIVPPADFLPLLEDVCRRHGIYLVVDEVKIGMGRTGRWFGYLHSGITPDVVTLGKPLGGGLPLSAVVARREILDAGTSMAMFTAAGNSLSCAAGLATIRAIEQDNLVERARDVGGYLNRKLTDLASRHPLVGSVRGLGLIQGVELVKDRGTKEPARVEAAKLVFRAYQLGLIVYYVGTLSNVIEITPPLVISEADVDEGVAILDKALSDVEAGKVSDAEIASFAGW